MKWVGKLLSKQEDWQGAMRAYYLADDKEGYSEAFAEARHEYFRQHFFLVVFLIVVVSFAVIKLLSLLKRKADQWADDVQMGRDIS